jgi:hypothetical protein
MIVQAALPGIKQFLLHPERGFRPKSLNPDLLSNLRLLCTLWVNRFSEALS